MGCLGLLRVVQLRVGSVLQLVLLHELGSHIIGSVAGDLIAKNLMSHIVFATKLLLELLVLILLLLEIVVLVEC